MVTVSECASHAAVLATIGPFALKVGGEWALARRLYLAGQRLATDRRPRLLRLAGLVHGGGHRGGAAVALIALVTPSPIRWRPPRPSFGPGQMALRVTWAYARRQPCWVALSGRCGPAKGSFKLSAAWVPELRCQAHYWEACTTEQMTFR